MARYETEIEDDDAFGPDGLLRDGARHRVSMMARDSLSPVQKSIMDVKAARQALVDAECRHQPGPARGVDRSAARRAYEDSVRESCEAWRGTTNSRGVVADADKVGADCTVEGGDDEGSPGTLQRVGGQLVCVADPDYSTDAASRPRRIVTADEARAVKKAAYDAMVEEGCEAWRKPLP